MFEDDATARSEGLASLGELMKEASTSKDMPFGVSVQVVREGVGVISVLTGQLKAQQSVKLHLC